MILCWSSGGSRMIDWLINWFLCWLRASMRRKFTSLEVCLSVISALLSLCCIGLIVYVCIGFKDEGTAKHQSFQSTDQCMVVNDQRDVVVSRYESVRADEAEWTDDDQTGGRVLGRAEELQQPGLQMPLSRRPEPGELTWFLFWKLQNRKLQLLLWKAACEWHLAQCLH